MVWKYIWSPSISTSMKLRSVSRLHQIEIARASDIVEAQFSGFALEKEVDALLRLQVLIYVFVAAPHCIDAIFREQRHKLVAKIDVGTVELRTCEQRVMEVRNLPSRI